MSTPAQRHRKIVRYGDIALDVIVDDAGLGSQASPAIVLLPSLGRDSEDFGVVASGLAREGFRVLRPQPRGVLGSTGPLDNITQHDLARDIAEVIVQLGRARAVVGGHAYGNWVARTTAADHPAIVRGVMLIAAAARNAPAHLGQVVTDAGDPALSESQRLAALRTGFFAPGHDPGVWLKGWHPAVKSAQRKAAQAIPREAWWGAGSAPILEIQAEHDPFMPPEMRREMRAAFGDRVTTRLIANASHALIPEQPEAVVAEIAAWVRALPA